MTTEARANLVRVALGITLAALGVLLLLVQAGTVSVQQMVHLWPLALVLIGGAMAWQALRGGPTTSSDVSMGGIIWLLIMGLVIMTAVERRQNMPAAGEGQTSVFAVMSGDRRLVTTEGFRGAQMTAIMGGAELDLRQTPLKSGEVATIEAFTLMGGGVIRVPLDWKVDVEATAIMGGITDNRRPSKSSSSNSKDRDKDKDASTPSLVIPSPAPTTLADAGPAPRLVLRGTVIMGGLVIKP